MEVSVCVGWWRRVCVSLKDILLKEQIEIIKYCLPPTSGLVLRISLKHHGLLKWHVNFSFVSMFFHACGSVWRPPPTQLQMHYQKLTPELVIPRYTNGTGPDLKILKSKFFRFFFVIVMTLIR